MLLRPPPAPRTLFPYTNNLNTPHDFSTTFFGHTKPLSDQPQRDSLFRRQPHSQQDRDLRLVDGHLHRSPAAAFAGARRQRVRAH